MWHKKLSILKVNTRNPFDRLHAAWSDKFRESKMDTGKYETYSSFIANFEGPYKIPNGYTNSFEAFMKYISVTGMFFSQNQTRRFCVGGNMTKLF